MAKRLTRLERARDKIEDANIEHQRAMIAEYPIGFFPVYVYGASVPYEVVTHGTNGRIELGNRENNKKRWVYEYRVHN